MAKNRSLDEAKRNPGSPGPMATPAPDSADAPSGLPLLTTWVAGWLPALVPYRSFSCFFLQEN